MERKIKLERKIKGDRNIKGLKEKGRGEAIRLKEKEMEE